MSRNEAILEFLPGALEVQQAPPVRWGRSITWLVMLLFIALIVWAALSPIDVSATTVGKVIPTGQVKVVQPQASGVVKTIYVDEGQTVEHGQLLFELDDLQVRKEITKLELQEEVTHQAWLLHTHLLEAANTTALDTAKLADLDMAFKALALESWALFQDELRAHDNQLQQKEAELRLNRQQQTSYRERIPYQEQRVASMRKLSDRQLASTLDLLDQEETLLTMRQSIDELAVAVEKIETEMAAIRQSKQKTVQAFKVEHVTAMVQKAAELEQLKEALAQQRQNLERHRIVAPSGGGITGLTVFTVGESVGLGDTLATIVPNVNPWVELYIQNKDIGFVQEGMTVDVRLDAYSFTKYGSITGRLTHVSDNAFEDENLGLVYKGKVEILENNIYVDGQMQRPIPGQSLTANVLIGKRTILDFLLTPIQRGFSNGLQER